MNPWSGKSSGLCLQCSGWSPTSSCRSGGRSPPQFPLPWRVGGWRTGVSGSECAGSHDQFQWIRISAGDFSRFEDLKGNQGRVSRRLIASLYEGTHVLWQVTLFHNFRCTPLRFKCFVGKLRILTRAKSRDQHKQQRNYCAPESHM